MSTSSIALPKQAFSINEACQVCGLGRVTLYKEIGAGRLRTVKVGRRTLVPAEALKAWLASLPTGKSHIAA